MYLEKATGIKYNKTKCMEIWLGSNNGNPRKPPGFKWNSDTIKILGYIYWHNTIQTPEENCEKLRRKNRIYGGLGHLQLSLIGKKILINQVMVSKIWHLAYVEKRPADIIQNIRKDIYDFLWNYR